MVNHLETDNQLIYSDLEDLPVVAGQVLQASNEARIWLFEGDLGAGKTTLIKAICQQLGVVDSVTSPTYSLINEYSNQQGNPIYHLDCYRLKSLDEAIDIGIEEYFYSGAYCLVEWGSKVKALLPDRYMRVDIQTKSSGARELLITKYE